MDFIRIENPCNVQNRHQSVHYHNPNHHNSHLQTDKTEHEENGILWNVVERKEEDKGLDDENNYRVPDGGRAPDGGNSDKGPRSTENVCLWGVWTFSLLQ